MTTWTAVGAAKLNLTLEVIGKRDDGFHDLASVAISLDLADNVRLTRTNGGRSISYSDDRDRRVSIETADDIIDSAWSALERRCPMPGGAEVEVRKRIPITSGLGGGSTDAAAFLRLARQAWNLPLTDYELTTVGAEVGSDVPVCLIGGAARVDGRGERITPIALQQSTASGWAVLLHRPEIPVPAAKTATMYRSLRTSDFLNGRGSAELVQSFERGNAPKQTDCVNSFDRVAREVMQGLTNAWREMGRCIARAAADRHLDPPTPLLAGAGPTLFAILPPDIAERAAECLLARRGFTNVARFLSRDDATAVRMS